ncbi:MAG: MFS transporter [Hydrocarboniphaga sp.]|uniref:Transmembrane efflux protein n=3 Tax=Nevskiaceae TaxID=568386 RepID=I8T6H8_9GAMM|nr:MULTISPECIES: MFS transporter [Hydrocarboniphaga]EIT69525.1 transmembrane efflux protein [Hydrocarboniphaga effusa AP103]MDZ4080803.1 MFS transporter [Hydrocarboniphaga sp.]MDZ4080886.1 MFS transporter [Hydrocarboniphaga sp.]
MSSTPSRDVPRKMPLALYALTIGAFGIGVTEFVIMGLLMQVSADFGVSLPTAGVLISGYALGVMVGAPLMTVWTARWPRKATLLALMAVFTLGNLACALAPNYATLLAARVLTSFAHGTFFGVGSVVATQLVAPQQRASAIAIMFTGLTVANVLGVPFGTWLGQMQGWRATFWAVAIVGIAAMAVIAALVPRDAGKPELSDWRSDLRALMRPAVLLGLLATVVGFGGVFVVFTYIAPLLTQISGFADAAVSPILLVFGGGLVIGNLLGGKFADRHLGPTLLGSLLALAIVMGLMSFVVHSQVLTVIFVGLLGAAAFATVPPLQMWVLEKASGAGQSLASSFNIGAFNLGNALGAWLGGMTIDHGLGLTALPWVGALMPLAALATAWIGLRSGKPSTRRSAALEA